MSRRTVILENVRKNYSHSKAVRNVIEAAEVVAYCENIADIGSCESHACIVRSLEHIVSRFNILAVLIRLFNVGKDHARCLFGVSLG